MISKRSATERLIIAKTLLESVLQDMPSAQPKRGPARWIKSAGGAHYCSLCGWALMDDQEGNPPIMGINFHRTNSERWTCCPGWNDWLMNYCPNCGAQMENGGKAE